MRIISFLPDEELLKQLINRAKILSRRLKGMKKSYLIHGIWRDAERLQKILKEEKEEKDDFINSGEK